MSNFEAKAKPIRELMNNPNLDHLTNTLSQSTEGIHEALPKIAQSLQITGTRALKYLHGKMPKPNEELVGDRDYAPSKTHQREWMKAHEIVNDPVSVLDHVRHGTLTAQHMDALSQVHPELLDEMRQKVMEHMEPKAVQKLPSTTKIALSQFLGQPISGGIKPPTIMANQIAMQPQGMPTTPTGKPRKTPLGGLEKLQLGKRAATETTELEDRPM